MSATKQISVVLLFYITKLKTSSIGEFFFASGYLYNANDKDLCKSSFKEKMMIFFLRKY